MLSIAVMAQNKDTGDWGFVKEFPLTSDGISSARGYCNAYSVIYEVIVTFIVADISYADCAELYSRHRWENGQMMPA